MKCAVCGSTDLVDTEGDGADVECQDCGTVYFT
jgi:uncharacterized Zn finger protein